MRVSICLTVPVVGPNDATVLRPEPDAMKLVGTDPSLLYGFHGATPAKLGYLSAAYKEADKAGDIDSGRCSFYLVDLTYRAPEGFEHPNILFSTLPPALLDSTPFITARRLSIDAMSMMGKLWRECATKRFGAEKVKAEDVNWAQSADYMVKFPEVAADIFERLPKLRCMLMPMRTQLLPPGEDVVVVGVAPKAQAPGVEAGVRLRPNVQVDLMFGGLERVREPGWK